jgi:hypothetical protein
MARTRDVVQAVDETVATERVPGRIADMPLNPKATRPERGGVSMANKIQKPRSRERGLLSGGLVALTVALAPLLYAQPVIRAYWWIVAVARAPHRVMCRSGSPQTGRDRRIQSWSGPIAHL